MEVNIVAVKTDWNCIAPAAAEEDQKIRTHPNHPAAAVCRIAVAGGNHDGRDKEGVLRGKMDVQRGTRAAAGCLAVEDIRAADCSEADSREAGTAPRTRQLP